jgi:hypothetical protein
MDGNDDLQFELLLLSHLTMLYIPRHYKMESWADETTLVVLQK